MAEPIKLATVVFEPASGADETLAPIIFLHGFCNTKELWHDIPQIVADATKRKAYAFDLREHGDSEWPGDFTFDLTVEDLYYFMDSKNISKAVLIGHSAGGWAASRVAMKTPEKVELIIVEDMNIGKLHRKAVTPSMAYAELWVNAVRNIPPYLSKTGAIRHAVDEVYNQIPPEKQKALSSKEVLYKCNFNFKRNEDGSYALKLNMPAIRKGVCDIDTFSTPPEGIYQGPAYFIYGGMSKFRVDQEEEEIREHFPTAELISVESASHLVHTDAPEEFTDIIIKCIVKSRKPSI